MQAKIHDQNELKGLQVKAELNKLGNPSRSYSELLLLDKAEDQSMNGSHVNERPLIGDRFAKLEKARASVTPLAVTLSNLLKKATASPSERK